MVAVCIPYVIMMHFLDASSPVTKNGSFRIFQVLNRLQLRLLEVKQRISQEGATGFLSSTPMQMRELHESVVRVITDLNNECYNALTNVRAKQVWMCGAISSF